MRFRRDVANFLRSQLSPRRPQLPRFAQLQAFLHISRDSLVGLNTSFTQSIAIIQSSQCVGIYHRSLTSHLLDSTPTLWKRKMHTYTREGTEESLAVHALEKRYRARFKP